MNKVMLTFALSFVWSFTANASTVYLSLGESTYIGSTEVICGNQVPSSNYVPDCINAARSNGFTVDQTQQVCASANEYTVDCIRTSRASGFTVEQTQKTCDSAYYGIADCIRTSRASGFTVEQTQKTCE